MMTLSMLKGAAALMAVTLGFAAPLAAQVRTTGIVVEARPETGGGTTLVVRGPASSPGLLVVGTERLATPRPVTVASGLTLSLTVRPRAVVPFTTDAQGRWTTHTDRMPAGLQVQALFGGLRGAALGVSAGAGAGTPPGVGASRATATASCPLPVGPGALVITEIQRDPAAVPDDVGEWFEIANRTPCDIDIEGWHITDEAGDFHFIGTGTGVVVPALGRLVLGRNADPLLNGGVPVDYEYANFTLDEVADRIVLVDPLGTVIDRVDWDATWPADEEGRALSLEPGLGAAANDIGSNWCLASAPIDPLTFVDFGTPGSANPSCSCMGSEDVPDASLVDSNCDGIDGDRSRAVFVAKSGSPAGLGTLTDPVDSVSLALAIAANNPALDHVYVSKGVYTESVQLVDGVSIWGGYDAATGWSRSLANVTEITYATAPINGSAIALRGTNLAQPIVVGDLDLHAASTSAAPGASLFAAKMHQVASLRLERVRLTADAAPQGATGATGPGYASTAYNGGAGGNGGSPTSGGDKGHGGLGPNGGGGGSGGSYPGDGSNGHTGGSGSSGQSAPGGTSSSPTLVGGTWAVPGGTGGTGGDGSAGSGGGGGGGGSGGFLVGTGGKGGHGGYGGRGGRGGYGGSPGGTSAAIVASSSQVELVDCVLEAGDGGVGGTSGVGYSGQSGFSGQSGDSGSGGYDGGKGGTGGTGGKGGFGGSGAGGSSFGVVTGSLADVQVLGSTSIAYGNAGAGGSGSGSAVAGLSAATISVPE